MSANEVENLALRILRARRADAEATSIYLEAIDMRIVMQNGNLDVSWIGPTDTNQSAVEAVDERYHVLVPFVAVRHKRRRDILISAKASGYVRPIAGDEWKRLVLAIARSKVWLRDVLDGMPTEAIAAREGKSERAIRLILSLAFLDPKLVKAALQGSLPQGVSARRLFDAPADWHGQWRAIGLSPPA